MISSTRSWLMQRIVASLGNRRLKAAIVVAALTIASSASATKPNIPHVYYGCVLEGFLIPADQHPNHERLPVTNKVDWKKFEGKLVRYSVRTGKGAKRDDFIKLPEVLGTCDPGQHKAQLAFAWYEEAVLRMTSGSRENPLPAVERALALDPTSCDAATLRAFALEKAKRRADALAQLHKAAVDMKCGYAPAQRLNDDNMYETTLPIGGQKK
jgi:hypothetical protein